MIRNVKIMIKNSRGWMDKGGIGEALLGALIGRVPGDASK